MTKAYIPGGSVAKNQPANAGDLRDAGSIADWGAKGLHTAWCTQ